MVLDSGLTVLEPILDDDGKFVKLIYDYVRCGWQWSG